LGQIKALQQPALPRLYEVWYTYATGYHAALNNAINEILTTTGTISIEELDRIYNTHLSPTRLTERIDNVGSKVMDEIEQVMAMIGAAVGSASSYSESLAGVSAQLSDPKDQDGLRLIVESLVHSTRDMEETNYALEARLNASKKEIHQLQENLDVARTESLTDPLTTLANRKYFDDALHHMIADTLARGEPLSLLLTDIDQFKKFNDTYGHQTGDQVLRLVAMAVKQNVKGQDVAARYGGEEFAIILPATELRQAMVVADHIRRTVMTKELMKRSTGEHLGHVTISIGVATHHPAETAQSLIERADSCLYAAKRNGRNCALCETDPEVATALETQAA
jgi:diguanylate cyclase